MVKVLIAGDVIGLKRWYQLLRRLKELLDKQTFDILFITGTLDLSYAEADDKTESADHKADIDEVATKLKIFAFHAPLASSQFVDSELGSSITNSIETINTSSGYAGIKTISHKDAHLTVAYVNIDKSENATTDMRAIDDVVSSIGYRGCDLLITSDWPKGMHHFLSDSDLASYRAATVGTAIGIGSGSSAAGLVAGMVRPRYHFVGSKGIFYQRQPYVNRAQTTSAEVVGPYTRLISVAEVNDCDVAVEKNRKWLHALSLKCIIHMSAAEVADKPAGATECPYSEDIPSNSSSGQGGGKHTINDGAEPSSKRFKIDEAAAGPAAGKFFFGNMGVAKPDSTYAQVHPGGGGGGAAGGGNALLPPSNSATNLFIGGLMRDTSEADLKQVLPNAVSVKKVPGKSFAFVDFSSHDAARKVVEQSVRRGLMIQGRTLNIGWAKPREGERGQGQDRKGSGGQGAAQPEVELVPPTEDAKVLFIGGLSTQDNVVAIDVTTSSHYGPGSGDGSISSGSSSSSSSGLDSITIESSITALLQSLVADITVTSVTKVNGKSYAFAEFDSHESAMRVITKSIQSATKLSDRPLSIGWASVKHFSDRSSGQDRAPLLMTAPSGGAKVLFVGNVPPATTDSVLMSVFSRFAVESIRKPEGKTFAFVEFRDQAQASNALDSVSRPLISTTGAGTGDGDVTVLDQPPFSGVMLPDSVSPLVFGWAKGQAADKQRENAAACWFCLASPDVKVHLIISCGDHAYVALPRGAITPQHCMVSPIECVPSRVHLSPSAKQELNRFLDCLDRMHTSMGLASLRFERALRTKGSRDHMQVHVVPLPVQAIQQGRCLTEFMQRISKEGLKFHEIQDERSVDEVVVNMEGGPYQEYFYCELPIATDDNGSTGVSGGPAVSSLMVKYRRFVFVREEVSHVRFPMQLGVELAAAILGQPERGHWKHCLLEEDEEVKLTDTFRDLFSPFDFTQED